MMDLNELYDTVVGMKNDLLAGNKLDAWDNWRTIEGAVIEVLRRKGIPGFGGSAVGLESAAPAGEPEINLPEKIRCELEECRKLCENPPAAASTESVVVAGLPFDGSIIKLILQGLISIAPLFIRKQQSPPPEKASAQPE